MTTKRKHDGSTAMGQDASPSQDEAASSTGTEVQGTPAENYPRKRIAIACNVCRYRKTRCDAAKPSCGFCTDLGIECTYRKPTAGDRVKSVTAPPEALAELERRLSQLEARLESTHQMVVNSSMLSPNVSHASETHLSPGATRSRNSSVNRIYVESLINHHTVPSVSSPGSYNFAFRQTTSEAFTPRPSLLTFRAPPYIHVESWDYTAEFYDDEILAGDQLHDQFELLLLQPIDLSKRTTRRLQQSFVENFLRWTPLFEAKACVTTIEQAAANDYMRQDSQTCLAFMFLALGAITEDRGDTLETQLPGLDYFARGCRILERLSLRTGDLTALQCRILQASYFKFAVNIMQAWNSITQAARDVMHILTSNIARRISHTEQEMLHRAFWACSNILHELEATLKMHPIGLRHFHDLVPLPQFEEEDSGFYYFLAQISLRKFLTQSLEVVGYQSGQVIYAPVITKELRKQMREWYDHLPSQLRFPKDATPVFDSRKSFLREQYIALSIVLGWPSVLKIMEHGDGDGTLLDQDTLAVTREQAEGCIKGCCLFLSVADEQLMGRRMGTLFALWATFASMTILLITLNNPGLSYIEETRQEHHIRNGYELLRPWAHLPLIGRGLERVRILMQQVGMVDAYLLPLDGRSPVVTSV